ncbi:hypothetical protein AVEN_6212-1 [Araneus ventricosus]|uniref:Uncharacterized protein n=1 Tax=Araneus ventricosus TaxID=182803 RepID=A0A4Y2NC13_ARAVE|nr:hypothetical protein AVEN_6212-1 [Araneus ventricosus]
MSPNRPFVKRFILIVLSRRQHKLRTPTPVFVNYHAGRIYELTSAIKNPHVKILKGSNSVTYPFLTMLSYVIITPIDILNFLSRFVRGVPGHPVELLFLYNLHIAPAFMFGD